jgi:GDP-4-dehydro-6-deoxy-D-mannose reductase
VQEILDILLGMSEAQIEVRPDPARLRVSDVPEVVGDITRIQEQTGWRPQIPLEQSLQDIMTYWREQMLKPR